MEPNEEVVELEISVYVAVLERKLQEQAVQLAQASAALEAVSAEVIRLRTEAAGGATALEAVDNDA